MTKPAYPNLQQQSNILRPHDSIEFVEAPIIRSVRGAIESLTDRIELGSTTAAEAAEIGMAVASILMAYHHNPLIHEPPRILSPWSMDDVDEAVRGG